MEAQDEFNDILTESYVNNIKRTFGGLSVNGCAKMNDTYGSAGTEMTDTWVLFGDPSVMVRTATPTNMTVSHVPQEYVGVTQLVVNCNTPGALVGLSVGGTWLGSGFVNNGSATITFPAISSACTIDITVTAYNKMPYFGTVPVLQGTGIETPSGNLSSINLYPNPASSYSMLTLTLNAPSPVSIGIFDMLGNEVMVVADAKQIAAGTFSGKLDVSDLQQGIYFCRIKSGEAVVTRKLIVTR
jgi:gingipain R/gingipain K